MGRKLAFDRILFVAVIALTLFGVLMVYSASSIWALEHKESSYYYLKRQVIWSLLGLGLMVLAMAGDYRHLRRPLVVYSLLGGSALLLLGALASPALNRAHRWIWIGPLSFQPSELAKLAVVVVLAYQLAKRRDRTDVPARGPLPRRGGAAEWLVGQGLVPCLVLVGPLIFLTLIQPDLGAAAMMALLFGVLFFVAGMRLRTLGVVAAVGLVLLVAVVVSEEYRMQRVRTFLDPGADPHGRGFQMQQSLLAVSSGGLTGRSLGESRQKLLYLPLPHTDFIYAVIGEELGMAGCIAVLAGFGVVMWRGLRASLLLRDPFGTYLGIGLTVFLVGQAMINVGVVLGMLPTKGLPLPFISYGGSSLAVSLASAGVLLNLSQFSN